MTTPSYNDLNEPQKTAVLHREGPLVIFAGAGSGKTRVIATRIGHLIENGIRPRQILAVTFTNKAAQEMRERVQQILPEARFATIATFHSACARWLREFAQELGFDPDFTIYDEADSDRALKSLLNQQNIKGDLRAIARELRSFFRYLKISGIEPGSDQVHQLPIKIPAQGMEFYCKYQEFLAQCNAMDFGDLLLNMLMLLRRNKSVRDKLQKRFRFVLVDEFQDTNKTQFELVKILCESHENLLVVGDDDQSIYSWRGATPGHIINFSSFYPDAKVIKLEKNYRCPENIVAAANALIANNETRVAKKLSSHKKASDLINFQLESDNIMESWWVADTIDLERSRFPYDDVAVFFRTNSQSRLLEEQFRKQGIPYTLYGSLEFYERSEIKDLTCYLKFLANPKDEVSLMRIINIPTRGLGKKAISLIKDKSTRLQVPVFEAMKIMVEDKIPRVSKPLGVFVDLLTELALLLEKLPLDQLVERILHEVEYLPHLKKKVPEQYLDKLENIHELIAGIADYCQNSEFPSLADWLQSISLNTDHQEEACAAGVSLMTLHMAKGLEFPRVYIVGCEDGLLPHKNSQMHREDLEEERRLFYVGMTRAKEKLSLVAAMERRVFQNLSANPPSRFLSEIPSQLIENPHQIAPVFSESTYVHLDDPEFRQGKSVYHPTYGRGKIQGLESRFGKDKAVVHFSDVGLRKVLVSQLDII